MASMSGWSMNPAIWFHERQPAGGVGSGDEASIVPASVAVEAEALTRSTRALIDGAIA